MRSIAQLVGRIQRAPVERLEPRLGGSRVSPIKYGGTVAASPFGMGERDGMMIEQRWFLSNARGALGRNEQVTRMQYEHCV